MERVRLIVIMMEAARMHAKLSAAVPSSCEDIACVLTSIYHPLKLQMASKAGALASPCLLFGYRAVVVLSTTKRNNRKN